MYDYSRGSVRRRAMRIARQRGWLKLGGGGVTLAIVLLLVAVVAAFWMVATIGALVFALVPWAIMGLLTGWVASKLTGARLSTGWTILAGIAGSWLGGAIFTGLLRVPVGGLLNPLHLAASVVGAAILITFVRVFARPSLPGAVRPRLMR